MSVTFLDIFHVILILVFSISTHVSQPHSQTHDNRTYTLKIFRDLKSQKSGDVLGSGLSRSHSPVPQTVYFSQTESSKYLSFQLGQPFMLGWALDLVLERGDYSWSLENVSPQVFPAIIHVHLRARRVAAYLMVCRMCVKVCDLEMCGFRGDRLPFL